MHSWVCETRNRLLTPSRNYPASIDFPSSSPVFFYAKKIHRWRHNVKVIVTGEPVAFYIHSCKGQLLLHFHFAHTIMPLGRLDILYPESLNVTLTQGPPN